jgi:hypothetical protein
MSGIVTVVQPGDGRQGDLTSIGVVFKLWDRDTGGALSNGYLSPFSRLFLGALIRTRQGRRRAGPG